MTDINSAPESVISVPAEGSDKPQTPMIPKARLDEEVAKRRTAEEQVAAMAEQVLTQVPQHLKALVPTGLSPSEQVSWFNVAKSTGVFDPVRAPVPETDSGVPKVTPTEINLWDLPASERIALGLRKGN